MVHAIFDYTRVVRIFKKQVSKVHPLFYQLCDICMLHEVTFKFSYTKKSRLTYSNHLMHIWGEQTHYWDTYNDLLLVFKSLHLKWHGRISDDIFQLW